jgi:hypothetical protein
MALALGLTGAVAAAAQLAVTAVDPLEGREGDRVDITGAGFGNQVADLAVIVDNGERGAFFHLEGVAPGQLRTRVGAVVASQDGPLVVLKGDGFELPEMMLDRGGRVYLLSAARWLPVAERADGPRFLLTAPSAGAFGSQLVAGRLEISLEEADGLARADDEPRRSVDIKVVVTPGDGEPPPREPFGGPVPFSKTPPRVVFGLRLDLIPPSAPPSAAEAAGDLAVALQKTFGPLGVTAQAEGAKVLLHLDQGIAGGFAVVRAAL